MAKSVLLAFACLGALASAAQAADVSVRSSLIERGEVSDNAFMRSSPAGATYTSASTLIFDVIAGTPTTRYALNSDFTYRKYMGPGAADTSMTETKESGAKFDVENIGKLGKANFGASWRRRDVASTLLEDVGVHAIRGDVNTYVVYGGFKRQLSATDSITWNIAGTSVDFSSPNSTPYVDVKTTGIWTRALSHTTDLITLVDFDRQIFDNAASTETTLWRGMSGVQTQLSPRLGFRGNAGVGVVDIAQNGTAQGPIPFTTFNTSQLSSGSSAALLWDALVTYKIDLVTQVSASAGQTIAPTILGDLTKRTSFGANLAHAINHSSSVSLSGDFTTVTSGGNESELITASAVYSYIFTREWRTQLGYIFRQRNDVSSSARSSTVFLLATRDATILP